MNKSMQERPTGAITAAEVRNLLPAFSPDQTDAIAYRTPKSEIKTRPGRGGGKPFSYVNVGYIIERLNIAFEYDWDFDAEVANWDLIKMHKQIIVRGVLKVRGKAGKEVIKVQFGSADVKIRKGTTTPVDIADDIKAATSDALKKCASYIGIAQDVYTGKASHGNPLSPQRPKDDDENSHKQANKNQINYIKGLHVRCGLDRSELNDHLKKKFECDNVNNLTKIQAFDTLEWLKGMEPKK